MTKMKTKSKIKKKIKTKGVKKVKKVKKQAVTKNIKKVKAKVAKVAKTPKVIKRRGRPPGSSNKKGKKLSTECDDDDYVQPKTQRFYGYCPKPACSMQIIEDDLVSKQIFKCPSCFKRDCISKLKSERKSTIEKPTNKKEYLNLSILHGEVH